MNIYFFIILFTVELFSCYALKAQKSDGAINKQIYYQYCFYDGNCTDSILALIQYNKEAFRMRKPPDKEFHSEQILRINPSESTDEQVIMQLLKSLEIYNLYGARKKKKSKIKITILHFFTNSDFKDRYSFFMSQYGQIEINNLSSLDCYNFSRKVTSKSLSGNKVKIKFGSRNKTEVICSKSYFEEVFFPEYVNYISVDHRHSKANIKVEKVEIKNEKDVF